MAGGRLGYSILHGAEIKDRDERNSRYVVMRKFYKYFAYAVAALYFFLAVFIFISPMFQYLPKTIKVTFSVFLFLYGAYRLARIWSKSREEGNE